MYSQRESLPAVTAAGVVALIFAAFGILVCGVVMLSLFVAPHLPQDSHSTALPEGMRVLAGGMYLFFLVVCVGELIVAINVFRRLNWARIAMLVWAGLMVVMCLFGLVSILLIGEVFSKTASGAGSGGFLVFLRLFLFAIYGIPIAIGIWWLILFTRPRVAAAFQNSDAVPVSAAADPSGFPAPAVAFSSPAPKKFAVPLPIAVIAALDVSGAVSMILFLFIPLPFQLPFFLFGTQIPQVPYKLFLALLGASYVAFVIGIFKLRRWGLDSLLIVKGLFLLSGIVTLFNPKFMAAMDATMAQISVGNPAFSPGQPIFSHRIMEGIMAFSYATGIALLIVMLIYRNRFLEAAHHTKSDA